MQIGLKNDAKIRKKMRAKELRRFIFSTRECQRQRTWAERLFFEQRRKDIHFLFEHRDHFYLSFGEAFDIEVTDAEAAVEGFGAMSAELHGRGVTAFANQQGACLAKEGAFAFYVVAGIGEVVDVVHDLAHPLQVGKRIVGFVRFEECDDEVLVFGLQE